MPRNGTGRYNLPPGINPVKPGTVVASSWANTTLNDIALALSHSLSDDGQTPWLADMNANGFTVKGLANPVDPQDAVTLSFLDAKAFDRIGTSGWARPESGDYPPISKTGPYTVSIPAGTGYVIDPIAGSRQVEWPATSVALEHVTTNLQTTIGVDRFNNIVQLPGPFDSRWCRQYVILATIAHPRGEITNVVNAPSILGSSAYAMYDVATAMQDMVISGGNIAPNDDSGLAIDVMPRKVFYLGGDRNDGLDPNFVDEPLQAAVELFPITMDGVVGPSLSELPVDKWNPSGGTIEDIPGAPFIASNFRLYRVAGSYVLLYPQFHYDSVGDAASSVWSENPVIPPEIEGGTLVAIISITKGATNIGNPDESVVVNNPGSGGGQATGGGAGGAGGVSYRVILTVTGDTVIDGTYRNSYIVVNSAVPVNLTIRTNDDDPDLDWIQGDCFTVLQMGEGAVNFLTEAGSTLTVPYLLAPRTRGLGATASCTCWAPDTGSWSASGDLFRPTTTQIQESYVVLDRTVLSGTNCAVGTNKGNLILPHNFALDPDPKNGLLATLITAQSTGSIFTVDVKVNGTSILLVPLTIDNGTKSSFGAAAPASYQPAFEASSRIIPAGAELTWDITQIGTSLAKGAAVIVTGQRA